MDKTRWMEMVVRVGKKWTQELVEEFVMVWVGWLQVDIGINLVLDLRPASDRLQPTTSNCTCKGEGEGGTSSGASSGGGPASAIYLCANDEFPVPSYYGRLCCTALDCIAF